MNISECRELVDEELIKAKDEALLESMKLRFELAKGALSDTSRLRSLKKDVARIETVLNERKLEAQANSEVNNEQ